VDEDKSNGLVVWDGNLRVTNITNIDLRWEIFRSRAQMVAVSGFYKDFKDPIEIVQYAILPNSFQPRNVGRGRVIGAEFEFRQNLTTSAINIWTLSGNVTVTQSQIEMSETEYQSRLENAREGQEIKETRDMAGQSPYLLNLGIGYEGLTSGFEAGLFYNVQGETLQYVGIADRPNVYSVPFHSLNFNSSKTVGAEERMKFSLKISNILNDDKEQVFKSFGTSDQIFGLISPRTSLSLGFSYAL